MAGIYSKIGSKILNMLGFISQSIACDFLALHEFSNTSSQVCSIAACGWAYLYLFLFLVVVYRHSLAIMSWSRSVFD